MARKKQWKINDGWNLTIKSIYSISCDTCVWKMFDMRLILALFSWFHRQAVGLWACVCKCLYINICMCSSQALMSFALLLLPTIAWCMRPICAIHETQTNSQAIFLVLYSRNSEPNIFRNSIQWLPSSLPLILQLMVYIAFTNHPCVHPSIHPSIHAVMCESHHWAMVSNVPL